jgi:hypothetical protein
MKKVVLLGLVTVAMTQVCFAGAQTTETVEVSGKDFHYNYDESIGDSEKGWIQGVHVSYKVQNNQHKNYWKLSYDHSKGDTNYDGAITNGITQTPYKGKTDNTITEAELTYGTPVDRKGKQYVYAGIGYHKWTRDLLGEYGYTEDYSWNTFPVGYRYEYTASPKLHGAIDASLQIMFNGKMETKSSEYSLGNKPGFKIEAPVTYQMDQHWGIVLTPWYQYSAIGTSDTVYSGHYMSYEPDSTNHQYGINVGVSYTF